MLARGLLLAGVSAISRRPTCYIELMRHRENTPPRHTAGLAAHPKVSP